MFSRLSQIRWRHYFSCAGQPICRRGLRMWIFLRRPLCRGLYLICLRRRFMAQGKCNDQGSTLTAIWASSENDCQSMWSQRSTVLRQKILHAGLFLSVWYGPISNRSAKTGFCQLAILSERTEIPIFKFKKPYFPAPSTIGVCGVTSNVGTTHLCIALSNYLHSRYFARTRYLEVNATHEIALLNSNPKSQSCFRKQGVHYYPELTVRAMADVLCRPCTYSVLDFGVLTPNTYREFLACDLRIVVCHASVWKTIAMDRFVHQLSKYNIKKKTVKITCYSGGIKDLERLGHKYDLPVFPAPFLKDPFHINSEFFYFFEQLMKGE